MPTHRGNTRPTNARANAPRGGASSSRAAKAPIPISGGVRWSRVRDARARIAADYYDRGEVRDQLVDALMDELLSR